MLQVMEVLITVLKFRNLSYKVGEIMPTNI